MNNVQFFDKLNKRIAAGKTRLVVGLDPRGGWVAARTGSLESYCFWMIDQTAVYAAAFKPNLAFFLQFGTDGINVLQRVGQELEDRGVPMILDAKFGDIGGTGLAQATAAFDVFKADAVTMHPYMGQDSVEAMLSGRPNKGVYLVAASSNPSALQVQGIETADNYLVYEKVVQMIRSWGRIEDQVGFVAGATYPERIKLIRQHNRGVPLLIPGIGTQGGDLIRTVAAASHNFVVNVSSQINMADDPRNIARLFRDQINTAVLQVS